MLNRIEDYELLSLSLTSWCF